MASEFYYRYKDLFIEDKNSELEQRIRSRRPKLMPYTKKLFSSLEPGSGKKVQPFSNFSF
jgi:hypothetical protein